MQNHLPLRCLQVLSIILSMVLARWEQYCCGRNAGGVFVLSLLAVMDGIPTSLFSNTSLTCRESTTPPPSHRDQSRASRRPLLRNCSSTYTRCSRPALGLKWTNSTLLSESLGKIDVKSQCTVHWHMDTVRIVHKCLRQTFLFMAAIHKTLTR